MLMPAEQQTPLAMLIEGCIHHDRNAQRLLFNTYKQLVLRCVTRYLGPRTKIDVEDVIQQTYIELFGSLPLYEGRASFETWVYRISSSVCMQYLRKKYRRRVFRRSEIAEIPADAAALPDSRPDIMSERREFGRHFYAALDAIRPERRMVFILADMEERPLDEVGIITGSSIGTVKSRLFRARRDLMKRLERYIRE